MCGRHLRGTQVRGMLAGCGAAGQVSCAWLLSCSWRNGSLFLAANDDLSLFSEAPRAPLVFGIFMEVVRGCVRAVSQKIL